ncbi:MAG: hypothetical protein C0392_10880 [Syntrophus sp. (in: bacteria)]|nr:hypothetical protein [Syntrophus sp. (in: bacteria)]
MISEYVTIEIKVITRAKKREIRKEGVGLRVKLLSLPRDGKANEELVEFLADFFEVRKADVRIVRGEKDRRKVVSIPVSEGEFKAKLGEMEGDFNE